MAKANQGDVGRTKANEVRQSLAERCFERVRSGRLSRDPGTALRQRFSQFRCLRGVNGLETALFPEHCRGSESVVNSCSRTVRNRPAEAVQDHCRGSRGAFVATGAIRGRI